MLLMWPFLLPVFEIAKESPLNQRVVQRKTTMHARRSHDRLIVEEPNDYFFFFLVWTVHHLKGFSRFLNLHSPKKF